MRWKVRRRCSLPGPRGSTLMHPESLVNKWYIRLKLVQVELKSRGKKVDEIRFCMLIQNSNRWSTQTTDQQRELISKQKANMMQTNEGRDVGKEPVGRGHAGGRSSANEMMMMDRWGGKFKKEETRKLDGDDTAQAESLTEHKQRKQMSGRWKKRKHMDWNTQEINQLMKCRWCRKWREKHTQRQRVKQNMTDEETR